MNIKITINCDNAAFEDAPATEIGRILRNLASDIEDGDHLEGCRLADSNGNTVGTFDILD